MKPVSTDPDVQDYRIRFLGSDSFNQTRNQSGRTPIGTQLCYPETRQFDRL